MSPPVFQFLREPEEGFNSQRENYSDTAEKVLHAAGEQGQEQVQGQGTGEEMGGGVAQAQEDDYSADADFAAYGGSERQWEDDVGERMEATDTAQEYQYEQPYEQQDDRLSDGQDYESGAERTDDEPPVREHEALAPKEISAEQSRPIVELTLNCDSPDSTPHTALSSSNHSLNWSPFPVPAVLHPQPPSPAAAKQSRALELLATEDQSGGVFTGAGADVFAGKVPPLAHEPAQFTPQRRTPTTRRQDRPTEPSGESQKFRFEY
jgi:hypothetical protein